MFLEISIQMKSGATYEEVAQEVIEAINRSRLKSILRKSLICSDDCGVLRDSNDHCIGTWLISEPEKV